MRLLRRLPSLSRSFRSRVTDVVAGATAVALLALAVGVPIDAQQAGPGVLPGARSLSAGGAFTGQLLAPNGSAAAPSYSFASDADTGFFREGGAIVHFTGNGVALFGLNGDSVQRQIKIHSGASLGWTAGDSTASIDVSLSRTGTGTLDIKNTGATNNAHLRLYGVDTYAGIISNWEGGHPGIPFKFGAGAFQWGVSTSGHLVAETDNTYDIGASGANRPRNYFGAGNVSTGGFVSTDSYVAIAGQGRIGTISDGSFRLLNAAGSALGAWNAASYGGAATTGTLVTNDAQTVADAGTINIGDSTSIGQVLISVGTDNISAVFALRGGAAPIKVNDPDTTFTITKDNAATINVYYELGNYKVQNKRGANRAIRVIRLGI